MPSPAYTLGCRHAWCKLGSIPLMLGTTALGGAIGAFTGQPENRVRNTLLGMGAGLGAGALGASLLRGRQLGKAMDTAATRGVQSVENTGGALDRFGAGLQDMSAQHQATLAQRATR